MNFQDFKNNLSQSVYLCILFVVAILQLLYIDNFHDWGGDFALYLNQTKHLLEGNIKHLHSINIQMMNLGKVGPYLYPNGFPVLLIFIYVFTKKLIYLKLIGVLFFILSVIMIKRIFSLFLNKSKSRILSLLFSIQHFFFFHTNYILSDIPALFFGLSTIYFYLKILNTSNNKSYYWLFAISALVSITIRTNYSLILYSIILIQLPNIYFKKYTINILLVSLFIVLLDFVFNHFLLIYDSSNERLLLTNTISHFNLLVKTLINNLKVSYNLFTLGMIKSFFGYLFISILFVLMIIKIAKKIIRNRSILVHPILQLVIINLGMLSIYLIWPYDPIYRFYLLNMVFVFLFSFILIDKYINKKSNLIFNSFTIYFIVLFIIQYKPSVGRTPVEGWPGTTSFNNTIKFLKNSTNKNSIILCNKPRVIFYYSNRFSCVINEKNLLKFKSNSLILTRDSIERKELIELCKFNRIDLHMCYKNTCLTIYQIKK